jgi:putative ABC transport system permease protein
MDLGVAQWRLGGLGQLSRLDIQLVEGASAKDLAVALKKLNLGLTLVTADDRDRRMSNLSRAYRVNLSVLALVALFTGAFLVFTTISFSVLRQQSELALLSVLGAGRTWLFGFVLTQALLVAAIGGLLGIGLGLGVASVLLRVMGGDLGAGLEVIHALVGLHVKEVLRLFEVVALVLFPVSHALVSGLADAVLLAALGAHALVLHGALFHEHAALRADRLVDLLGCVEHLEAARLQLLDDPIVGRWGAGWTSGFG